MGRKQGDKPAMTSAERNAKWYKEHAFENGQKNLDKRIREGGMPTAASLKKYKITREYINNRRAEADPKLPPLMDDRQMHLARAFILQGKKGDPKQVFAQRVRIEEPIPEPPRYIEKSVAYTTKGTRSKGKGKAKDDGRPGTSKSASEEEEKVYIPKNLNEIEVCIEEMQKSGLTHKRKNPKTGEIEEVPISAVTNQRNRTAMTKALEWWSHVIRKPLSKEEDISEWLNKHAKAIEQKSKTVTYKDFPKGTPDMKLKNAVKHKLTDITGTINSRCPQWGEYFQETYPDGYNTILRAMRRVMGEQEDDDIAVSEKQTALPWQPVRDRANYALENPPKKGAKYNDWAEHVMLIMLAASDETGKAKKGKGRPSTGVWPLGTMHPFRDNIGSIKIVSSEKDIPKVVQVHKQKGGDGETDEDVVDYYINPKGNKKTGEIHFRSHKTRGHTGTVIQKMPMVIHQRIKEFITKFPRQWLFIKPSTLQKPIADQEPLGKGMREYTKRPSVLGMTVKDSRHSFITYYERSKRDANGNYTPRLPSESKAMAKAMMTGYPGQYQEYILHGIDVDADGLD